MNTLLSRAKSFKAAVARARRRHKIAVVGDSHVEMYAQSLLRHSRSIRPIKCQVSGATVSGLKNPRSTTNSAEIFESFISQRLSAGLTTILCIGEVDCGFVFWLRHDQGKGSMLSMFRQGFAEHTRLIDRLISAVGADSVIISSVPLPTIKDEEQTGEVAIVRKAVSASQRDRTRLTLMYNGRLKSLCQDRGIRYCDLQSSTLCKKTLAIKDAFLNPDKADHHHGIDATAPVIAKELDKLGLPLRNLAPRTAA